MGLLNKYIKNLILCCLSILICCHLNANIIYNSIEWALLNGKYTAQGLVSLDKYMKYKLFGKSDILLTEVREVSPKVQKYISDQLGPFLKDKNIKIYSDLTSYGEYSYSTDSINHIYIAYNQATRKAFLQELLEKENLTEEDHKKLMMINFALHHEAGHIKHNDRLKYALSSIIIPNLNWIILKKIQSYYENKIASFWNLSLKITLDLALAVMNEFILKSYSKYREQEADNIVPNNKALIEGGIMLHDGQEDLQKGLIRMLEKCTSQWQRFAVRAAFVIFKLTREHPTDKERVEKLKDRLLKINKA